MTRPNYINPFDTHDWTPKDSLDPRCQKCGSRLFVPYGDITKAAGEPCLGNTLATGEASAVSDDR